MAHLIDSATCINCGACDETCPVNSISEQADKRVIDAATLIYCGACVDSYPVSSIAPD